MQANGGGGAIDGDFIGGKGGGGRIAFYSTDDFGSDGESQAESPPTGVSVSAATQGDGTADDGTFYDGPGLPFLRTKGTVIEIL